MIRRGTEQHETQAGSNGIIRSLPVLMSSGIKVSERRAKQNRLKGRTQSIIKAHPIFAQLLVKSHELAAFRLFYLSAIGSLHPESKQLFCTLQRISNFPNINIPAHRRPRCNIVGLNFNALKCDEWYGLFFSFPKFFLVPGGPIEPCTVWQFFGLGLVLVLEPLDCVGNWDARGKPKRKPFVALYRVFHLHLVFKFDRACDFLPVMNTSTNLYLEHRIGNIWKITVGNNSDLHPGEPPLPRRVRNAEHTAGAIPWPPCFTQSTKSGFGKSRQLAEGESIFLPGVKFPVRILLYIHQIGFIDSAGSRLKEANPIHGATSDLHHLAHRVCRVLEGFCSGIKSVHLAISRQAVGKINIQAGNIPQSTSEFATIEAPGTACP